MSYVLGIGGVVYCSAVWIRSEAVVAYKFSDLLVAINGLKTLSIWDLFSTLKINRRMVDTLFNFRFNGRRGIKGSSRF